LYFTNNTSFNTKNIGKKLSNCNEEYRTIDIIPTEVVYLSEDHKLEPFTVDNIKFKKYHVKILIKTKN